MLLPFYHYVESLYKSLLSDPVHTHGKLSAFHVRNDNANNNTFSYDDSASLLYTVYAGKRGWFRFLNATTIFLPIVNQFGLFKLIAYLSLSLTL